MSTAHRHAEWLSLLEISGPFLSMPVLLRAFPQGLDAHDPEVARSVRLAYDEWADNQQGLRPDPAIHAAWVRFVLRDVLGFADDLLLAGPAIPESLKATVAEHGETLRPDLLIQRPGQPPRILVQVVPPAQDLDKPLKDQRWKASPATRMAALLRAAGVRLGLVINGERWMLVHAQAGETTSFISWYAGLWLEERVTLQAFRSLLGVYRTFGVPDSDTLEALLAESAANQQEVTDQLGYQVRQAVEVLVQSLDRIDKDRGRKLLEGVSETTLYEAALTVMMRLVFLFSAEERGLLLLGKPMYDQHYAISTLRAQLRETADQHSEAILELRNDAWSRLLATFRAVYGGVQHEDLRLPAYGGHLFDPDRYPFLEGRAVGTTWDATPARPVPIDNRTVLHLLEALQILRIAVPGGGSEPRRLSFRALDVEQIGHVYEGLLDHTAKRAPEPVLGLAGTKDREPEVPLARLEALLAKRVSGVGDTVSDAGSAQASQNTLFEHPASGNIKAEPTPNTRYPDAVIAFLREETGRSASALANALDRKIEGRDLDALRAACDNDTALVERVLPFAGLLRPDTFGRPVVITKDSVYVTAGTDRRSTGTHYTPRSLTEPIVQHTLDPLVYHGPADGLPKEQWALHPAERILALTVCDMAMGSGAFLVQACRYLSERLVEAWEQEETGIGHRVSGIEHTARSASHQGGSHEGGSHDGAPIVPRFGGLAEKHGSRYGDLSANAEIPKGGDVWPDQPDSARGGVGAGQYRGGLWPEAPQGIPESLVDSSRLATGSGDASPDRHTPGVSGPEGGEGRLGADAGRGQDASSPERVAFHRVAGSKDDPANTRYPIPDTRDPEERLAIARKLIADRCLYGVDKNPLAVEMAKLSLWLVTLQKDRPFSFLDHALRCGDSLLGVSSTKQILNWDLATTSPDAGAYRGFLTQPLERALTRALALRRKIRATPVLDVRDAEQKARWLNEADEALGLVKLAADLLVAAQLHKDKKRRAELSDEFQVRLSVAAKAWEAVRSGGAGAPKGDANRAELAALRAEADELLEGRTPFHWPLEFPEVFIEEAREAPGTQFTLDGFGEMLTPLFAQSDDQRLMQDGLGFAAIVGNPPFQGGKLISGALGRAYRDYLVENLANDVRGHADLCAYFFLRAGRLLRLNGQSGLIATNTIAQGDTREVGLEQLAHEGFVIPRAVPSRPWPGLAAVEVAHVWVRRGVWRGTVTLEEQPVAAISSFLTVPGTASGTPQRLKANEDKSFIGSFVLGMGFVLTPEDAERLITAEPRNREVLFPYLNGEDLNSRPDQSPSRWVISFFDRTLDEAAAFPNCFRIVEERVMPERTRLNDRGEFALRKPLPQRWWQFADRRPALYAMIARMERVLVLTIVTQYLAPVFCPTGWIYAHRCCVFPLNEWWQYAALQSSIHDLWARTYSSSLETRLNYSPSDCFETFPFPASVAVSTRQRPLDTRYSISDTLEHIGERYHIHRQEVMLSRNEGLTKTYNRFHDTKEMSDDIAELRRLHVAMDQAVAAAYGWADLDLGHGFHTTKQGLRYTISEAARRVVLDRLLALNHERYTEEVAQGLHDKGAKKAAGKGKRGKTVAEGQGELF